MWASSRREKFQSNLGDEIYRKIMIGVLLIYSRTGVWVYPLS